jgi:hypothetical protein
LVSYHTQIKWFDIYITLIILNIVTAPTFERLAKFQRRMAELQRDKFEREIERELRIRQKELAKKNLDNYSENFTVSFDEIEVIKINDLQSKLILGSGSTNIRKLAGNQTNKNKGFERMYQFYVNNFI